MRRCSVSDDDPQVLANILASSLAGFSEAIRPLTEAVEGYREGLERLGYSEALARKMAADYHAALLRAVIR